MGTYIVKRLIWSVILLLAVVAVTYVVFFVIPTERSRYVTRNELSASDERVPSEKRARRAESRRRGAGSKAAKPSAKK